eukprot:COSAG05_NODE_4686_length_1409_cov_1.612977_3_plen_208_part_00
MAARADNQQHKGGGRRGTADLWLFGGVAACGEPVGVCADGTVLLRNHNHSSHHNMTCPHAAESTTDGDDNAGADGRESEPCRHFTADYIDSEAWAPDTTMVSGYSCGGALWRFDTNTYQWSWHQQLPGGAWPQPRCGGQVVTFSTRMFSSSASGGNRGFLVPPASDDDDDDEITVMVGGWHGKPVGMCSDEGTTCVPAVVGWHWGAY